MARIRDVTAVRRQVSTSLLVLTWHAVGRLLCETALGVLAAGKNSPSGNVKTEVEPCFLLHLLGPVKSESACGG